MRSILSTNLRRLRQAKGYTQEQLAQRLNTSPQSVSRWETGATLPDILLLPTLAELYCVTVDDLFRPNAEAYTHLADRLSSLYEKTRERDDFVRADEAYGQLFAGGQYSTEDLRSYGCIHMMAMWECADKALRAFDKVIAQGPQADERSYYRCRGQKMQLLSFLGKQDLIVSEQEASLVAHPQEPWEHVLMLSALCSAKRYERAYAQLTESVQRHPNAAELCVYGGEICQALGRMEEAVEWLDRGLALDPGLHDATYAKAELYETLGDFVGAEREWNRLAEDLEAQGFPYEAETPRKNAAVCRLKSTKSE